MRIVSYIKDLLEIKINTYSKFVFLMTYIIILIISLYLSISSLISHICNHLMPQYILINTWLFLGFGSGFLLMNTYLSILINKNNLESRIKILIGLIMFILTYFIYFIIIAQ